MSKRYTDTEKWKKQWIRKLPPEYKLLWMYILDDVNHAGIWEVDFEVASLRLGIDVEESMALQLFGDKIEVFDDLKKWFLPGFIEFQYGELNASNKVHKSVLDILKKYGLLEKEGSPKGLGSIIHDAMDKDKDKDKERGVGKTKFEAPTTEQVKEYCVERRNSVDSKKFVNYYTSNGWKVGKNPMKDWRAAVRTWENTGFGKDIPKIDNIPRKPPDKNCAECRGTGEIYAPGSGKNSPCHCTKIKD